MVVSIHQPNFMPWYPFFEKIKKSDIFVILGHCQYEKNNFQNRFDYNGKWNTLSVKKGNVLIKEKKYLNPEKDWRKIRNNLKYYKNVLEQFDDCISENLLETNTLIIKKVCNLLGVKTEIVSDFPTSKLRTERLVEICRFYGATTYLSGESGKKYLDLELFGDINVIFHANKIKKHSLQILNEIND